MRTTEIPDALVQGHDVYGSQSFDQHLSMLVRQNVITMDVGKEAVTSPSDFERAFMVA